MSRYTIPHAQWEIIVGWDQPLQTLFVQVLHPVTADRAEQERAVLWVGTQPRALLTVEAVRHYLRPYTVLPRDIATALQRDLDTRTPPTVLQHQVRSLLTRRR